jgi:DNA-binding NarL/FixJ family response regulator
MKIKILIADDHQVFIDGMSSMLSQVDEFEVIGSATHGEQLIQQVVALQPDVVLSDIQMPGMDGIEATQVIHKSYPSVKIIALTMLNETMFIKKMLEAGAYGYVLKTTDKNELIKAIRQVAAGEKYFSQEVTAQLMNNFSDKKSASPLEALTRREREILAMIAQGLTDKEIAEKFFLSPLTVTTHRKNVLSKLGLKNKVELTRFAIEHKLV